MQMPVHPELDPHRRRVVARPRGPGWPRGATRPSLLVLLLSLISVSTAYARDSEIEPDAKRVSSAASPAPALGATVDADGVAQVARGSASAPAARPGADPGGREMLEAGESDASEEAAGDEDDAWGDEDDTSGDEDDAWDDWDEELDTVPSGYPDPLEPVNRVTLSFNNAIDRLVLDPVTQLYRFVLPDFSRAAIVRLFDNVNSPSVMINDALQLEWNDAAICMSRLLVNSTLGLGGFMDPALDLGLDPHSSDFGQTLTIAGVPAGMYFVLPLLGPANARDAVGLGVDSFLHPTFYVLGGTDLLIFGGSAGLTARARHFEEIQALKESSVDIYSALRSGYYQNREAEIWSRREQRRAADPS